MKKDISWSVEKLYMLGHLSSDLSLTILSWGEGGHRGEPQAMGDTISLLKSGESVSPQKSEALREGCLIIGSLCTLYNS